jgi:ADP-ribosyltransferase exoenzyme
MAPLAVGPSTLDGAGAAVVTAGKGLGSVISTLTAALSGCSGMAGDDPAGAALGHSYDSSAAKLVEAMVATRNGLCGLGDGVRMSAHNYSLAEAQSDISGRGGPLPTPTATGPISAGSPPSSVGTGDGAPPGWGWVAPYIGMIWPTGDSGKLRAAAAAWSTAGTQFGLAEILGTGAPMGAIRAQQIPEGPTIDRAFTDAYSGTTGIVQQCQKIAAQLNSYAAKVDKVHAAILDLLARICDPMTGIKEVWDFLTDEDEDEIKKIADDIRTVVDNFSAEVNALRAEIAATLAEAVTIATTMGGYAAKQWDQFLHGTDVGRAIDTAGQYAEGMWSEAGVFVKGLYDVSQLRLMLDPIGYAEDLGDEVKGALPLVGLGPDGGPGFGESWKQVGKSIVHCDEWSKNPAEAAGESVFDIATLALPGGPLSKLGKTGRAAVDALRGLRKPPEIPKPPSIEPPTKPPVEPPPPSPKPPEPGHPAPAPPARPAPGPANGPLPHSPTESKPPDVEKPPASEPPKPAAGPPGSAGKPPVPAPAEQVPAPHPHPREAVPAAVPISPGGTPAEPVPSAAGPSPSVPTPPVPSLPEPRAPASAPAGGLPAEAPPPFDGAPHGGEPSTHPPEPPQPHDGTPHGPGDGGMPHQHGDGGAEHGGPVDGSHHPIPLSALTSDDLSALADYTGSGYQDLNSALRSDALDASQHARVEALNRALEKLPAYEGPVVRGSNIPPEVLDRYQPGQVITESAFICTTTNPAVAQSPAFAGNVEFRILSTTGRDVSSVSMFPGEQEILFRAGAKFYIINRTVDPLTGRTIIEMIER